MRATRFATASAAVLTLGLGLGGCSQPRDDLPREAVSGKVTFEGEPIAKGAILFRPSGGPGTVTDAGGLIRDGEYHLGRTEGPVPGTYKVIITEEGEGGPAAPGAGGEFSLRPAQKASRISSKYNTSSTLVATVKAGEPNTFDFELKKNDDREPAPGTKGRRR